VVIGADAHDLGAGGFELRQGRLEAVQFAGQVGVNAAMKV